MPPCPLAAHSSVLDLWPFFRQCEKWFCAVQRHTDTMETMALLRFLDPEGSDLYVHTSPEGFVTYVAGIRFDTGQRIGGLFDNMSFTDATREQFTARLELLRTAGYRVPGRVLNAV